MESYATALLYAIPFFTLLLAMEIVSGYFILTIFGGIYFTYLEKDQIAAKTVT